MPSRRLSLIFAVLCGLLTVGAILPAQAQQQAVLSLTIDSTDLQTGQSYEIAIHLDGVSNLWAAYIEIAYDPSLVYVIGTKSGSPVTPGAMFGSDTSLVVFNYVKNNLITFAPSRLRPAEPVNSGGIVGTFRIYPLQAGNTPMLFSKAEIVQPDSTLIPFMPVLVDLTITGDPVEAPDEATATLAPTVTPSPPPQATVDSGPSAVPTLVNVTAAPATMTPVPAPATAVEADNTGLIIALVVLGITGLGLVMMGLMWLRSRRR